MMDLDVKKLTVKYRDRTVGYLAMIEEAGIAFQYDDRWVKDGFSISPISLPLSDRIYRSAARHFDGLFGAFFDSLPDGWGTLLVRRHLRSKGINFERLSPLTRLTLVGANGLGGLAYEPTQSLSGDESVDELDLLATEIKAILEEKTGDVDLDRLVRMGGSSGGARPKVHLRMDGADWIVKFPASVDPVSIGISEYEANRLAKSAGIAVNEFRLFPSKRGPGYFGAKRFDRQDGRRVHMISLSSLLETSHQVPNLDYVHLFQVIRTICRDQEDVYEAYRRMCYNVLYEDKDDHGKNHAFLYDEGQRGYRLSPAYDLTHTPDKFEHEMTVLGKGNPTEEDLVEIAATMKLSKARTSEILRQVKSAFSDRRD